MIYSMQLTSINPFHDISPRGVAGSQCPPWHPNLFHRSGLSGGSYPFQGWFRPRLVKACFTATMGHGPGYLGCALASKGLSCLFLTEVALRPCWKVSAMGPKPGTMVNPRIARILVDVHHPNIRVPQIHSNIWYFIGLFIASAPWRMWQDSLAFSFADCTCKRIWSSSSFPKKKDSSLWTACSSGGFHVEFLRDQGKFEIRNAWSWKIRPSSGHSEVKWSEAGMGMVQNDSQIAVLYFCDQCFLFNSEPQESSRIHAESHEWRLKHLGPPLQNMTIELSNKKLQKSWALDGTRTLSVCVRPQLLDDLGSNSSSSWIRSEFSCVLWMMSAWRNSPTRNFKHQLLLMIYPLVIQHSYMERSTMFFMGKSTKSL